MDITIRHKSENIKTLRSSYAFAYAGIMPVQWGHVGISTPAYAWPCGWPCACALKVKAYACACVASEGR